VETLFHTLIMIALASIPLGFGIGWPAAAYCNRMAVRPMQRIPTRRA
jgi:hypothetical protein